MLKSHKRHLPLPYINPRVGIDPNHHSQQNGSNEAGNQHQDETKEAAFAESPGRIQVVKVDRLAVNERRQLRQKSLTGIQVGRYRAQLWLETGILENLQ